MYIPENDGSFIPHVIDDYWDFDPGIGTGYFKNNFTLLIGDKDGHNENWAKDYRPTNMALDIVQIGNDPIPASAEIYLELFDDRDNIIYASNNILSETFPVPLTFFGIGATFDIKGIYFEYTNTNDDGIESVGFKNMRFFGNTDPLLTFKVWGDNDVLQCNSLDVPINQEIQTSYIKSSYNSHYIGIKKMYFGKCVDIKECKFHLRNGSYVISDMQYWTSDSPDSYYDKVINEYHLAISDYIYPNDVPVGAEIIGIELIYTIF